MDKAEQQKFFCEERYLPVRRFLDPALANLLKGYMEKKARMEQIHYAIDPDSQSHIFSGDLPGQDLQVQSSFAWYGDPMMDTLLEQSTAFIGDMIDKQLFPTYSYCRLYLNNAVLDKHIDRHECQFSTTICLGGDPWPIFFEDKARNEIRIDLEPGDMVVYAGVELQHWREPFTGSQCAQVFLHYGDVDFPMADPSDGRLALGIPNRKVNKEYLENTLNEMEVRRNIIHRYLTGPDEN